MKPGTLLGGRYRIADQIGSGGMARVFRAIDLVIDRQVAVKLLLDNLASDPLFRARFLREARAAGQLSHPNIVAAYDVGEQDGIPFIVLQLVEGHTLKDELAQRGQMPIPDALDIASQLAGALAYAHANGVVHRDVKPANILLAPAAKRGDHPGRPLLSDFGIATVAGDETLTTSNQVFGTTAYLAPERVQGAPATPASDVYSLGVVLYEMLAGRTPFQAETPLATAIMQRDAPPPSLRALNPAAPVSLERLVMRALAKDPNQRYSSAAEVATAIEQIRMRSTEATGVQTASLAALSPMAPAPQPAAGRPPRISRTWSFGGLIAIGVAALVTLGAAANFAQTGRQAIADSEPTATVAPAPDAAIEVPAVVGLSFADAQARLTQAGLQVARHQANSASVPAGVVISQDPPAGQSLPPNATVQVVVSSGTPEATATPAPPVKPPDSKDPPDNRGQGHGPPPNRGKDKGKPGH